MADNELSVGIDVVLDVNTKKLEDLAKRVNMTGDQLQEALSLKVDWTSLTLLKNEIVKLESMAASLGTTLANALGGNPAGQQELINSLRERLALINKIKEADAQVATIKSGKQVDIKEAISQELFGDKGVKFNVGAYKSEIDSRAKGFIEDFGDDAIELVDVLEESAKGLLQDLNMAAKEAADQVGVQFKSSTEMLTGFNANTMADGAENLAAGLRAVSENIALSGKMLINGQMVSAEDLRQAIRDFEVDSKGVFTISPAMFLDAYRRVIVDLGENLVTQNITSYKDLNFKPLENKAPAQAAQNVVEYMQKILDEIAAKPGGAAKIDAKLAAIEEKIILEILEKARRAGERALKDPNDFNTRMLGEYAPSADVAAIAGSGDVTNLERYADEAAAKVANELEQLYGLAEGTVATYVKIFSQDSSDPNKLFDLVRAARAIVGSSFTDMSGTNVPSATSRGLVSGNIPSIGEQIIANPAILQNVLSVQEESFNKKVEALLAARIKDQGGLAPGDLEQAVYLALVQSLAGQISRIKISPTEVATAVAAEVETPSTGAAGTVATPAIEEAPKKDYFDRVRQLILEQRDAYEKLGLSLVAALDTEFNPALQQFITELNLKIKTVDGKFVDLLSFIHIPTDAENLALDKSPTGAKSVKDLQNRAAAMGLDLTKLGSIDNPEANAAELYSKTKALVEIINILDELGVGLTGSNFKGAERANILKLIGFVNGISGMPALEVPKGLDTAWDSVTEFKKAAKTSPEIALVTEQGAGLGNIMANISRHFPEFLDQFRDLLVMTEAGPVMKGAVDPKTGKPAQLPAHFAATDTVMSIIVRAFYEKFASSAEKAASVVVKNVKPSSAPSGPTTPGGPGGGGPTDGGAGGPGGEDPMERRKRADAERTFHSQREILEQLQAGLTQDELYLVQRRLEVLRKDQRQVDTARKLTAVEEQLTELRTADAVKARNEARRRLTPAQQREASVGFIGPIQSPDASLVRNYNDLVEAEMRLTQVGRKREAQVVATTLSETRYKDMQEQLRENTRKQVEAEAARAQAGKQFSAVIKANLREELEAQKAVQKANSQQINQWVTARYALYDVGNFYQNLSQQMFRLTRQIFNTTQTYRSFETAFTSVERAMQISGSAAIDMRDQFISLSEALPVTFEDLSRIATLGAQMGIGAGGIRDFTETVAKFSAITSISAETVAQKFGRIAELADIDSSQFTNLGSAVSFAGVNAVATDTEILTLSESIAAVSKQAGFAPGEIIGMSTALASVGIQAEQARGVFTRVFADIDRAVSRGGSGLDAFAKASGMSSEEFAKQWGTEGQSYQVFRRLLGGLGSSADATAVFDALNIVETREINTLTRLAQNLNVVDQAVSDSNQSFADGTFLGASFEKTADNLDSQIVIFKNNLDSLIVSFNKGLSPAFKEVVEAASQVIEVLKAASGSTFAQRFVPLALGITAIGGAAAITAAGLTKLIAQIYAFRVAQINRANSSALEMTGPISRIKQLTGAYSDLIDMRSGLKGAANIETRGIVTPVNYSARSVIGAQIGAIKEYAKTRDWASAKNIMATARENDLMRTSNVLMIQASKNGVLAARQQADAVERLIDARRADILAQSEQQNLGKVATADLMAKKFYVQITEDGAKALTDEAAAAILAAGANANASEQEKKRAASLKLVNAETQVAVRSMPAGLTRAMNFTTGLIGVIGTIGAVVSMVDMLRVAIEDANKVKLMESGGGLQSLREAMAEDTKIWNETGNAISTVKVEYSDFSAKTYDAYDAVVGITGANENLKKSSQEVTEEIKSQTVAIGQNTQEWILNSIITNEKVNNWLKDNPGLFDQANNALKNYGTSFSDLMKIIMENPEDGEAKALEKVDGALRKARQAVIDYEKAHPTTGRRSFDQDYLALTKQVSALDKVKEILREIAVAMALGLDTTALQQSLRTAMGAVEEFDESVQDVTKSVKTLTQWAGEVGQVMQAAFDIRYGKINALDNIRKAWSDLRKKADDARKAVKKAQDQLNSLKANRTVLEYQLNIALKYGDSKRAADIQAKLDENTTSTAEANDQLAEAQKALSTDLRSGSDAAIENRQALSGLVQTYIPYLQALLNSGKSQKDVAKEVDKLKTEFAKQATEIGFAEADLQGYLKTFDSYKTVVEKMPNTVTVKIDGLPAALRALREFASAANGELDKINLDQKAKDAALVSSYNDQISVLKWQAQAINENKTLSAAGRASSLSAIGAAIKDIVGKIAKVKAATGGYISGPGTATSDSIPAMLSNGEFVMSAKSVSTYGVDFMNALNQSRVMYSPAQPSMAQTGGGSSVVYLSPDDRALLRAAIDRPVTLYADSTRLAQSVNNGNKILAQRGTV